MTIYDFLYYFCDTDDQKIIVYSLEKEEELFKGDFGEIRWTDIADMEVESVDTLYDPTVYLTINVE